MADYLPFTRPSIDEETVQSVAEVLRSGWITTGPKVAEFEKGLAAYLGGGRHVRSFLHATGALEEALVVAGVQPGDEVIVPAMTFAATANVVLRLGAKPVLVDVDLKSRNLLLDQTAAAITPKTRAIMPVHLNGLAADLDGVYALARQHQLRVVEDAAQAVGTLYKGRKIGSFGDLVVFSFHANKNLTTVEGGAVSLADAGETRQLEILRFHGITKHADGTMDVTRAASKHNLTDVAAVVGLGQLRRLDAFNKKRRELAYRYFELLGDEKLGVVPERGDEGHSWHMFTLLPRYNRACRDRNQLRERMHAQGIGLGIHYQALNQFTLYKNMGYREGQFPNAERIGTETVTLPLFPAMAFSDVDRVCEA
ncbi:MAG: DegT/DnrJ/EryC1/StrS aminotransferase family protein, partial [Gammaproteobacteria bacterium]|nr:DegT/DnrJ/EryC1/StrS aminotransferase family protein [Gammaproteobacteria bacterium]MDE1984658.1 DegT/DnrJ/EryC1/StrS aminotransferase family protein [Gammaproteobacteria bacterium]MDE2109001.1 DegT/DnrJ/EryC1/StrS aminotransferase family protein [Gammaproteobacteria bacterium]